jgi:DNA repair protein RecO (recombination protein O)
MHNENVQSIVLSRTNYGEADKIITSLTSTGKKVSIMAKGVRKPKSKLVAGTELFCVADICYIPGKSSMATLTSARILQQHTKFLGNLDKVTLAYDVIKIVNKHTEDAHCEQYFSLLRQLYAALDDESNDIAVLRLWAWMQVLQASGHTLQLDTQTDGENYNEETTYAFDPENGGFIASANGRYSALHIKLLRLIQSHHISSLQRVQNAPKYANDIVPVVKLFVENTY